MSVWRTAGIIADGTFDDPENARIIYLAAGGLLLIAVGLGVGTWIWWRNAKVEHPALGPLEVMGSRRWSRSDFNERRRRLDAARPAHEADSADDAAAAEVVVAPIDLESVLTRDDPENFDDLLDPDARAEPPADPVPVAVSEAEPVAEAAAEVAAESEPEPEHEQLELVAIAEAVPPRPAVITVDTAPKRAEPTDDTVTEVTDGDPTPVPIDPLLRLQID